MKDFTHGNTVNYHLNVSVILLQHRVLKLPVPDSSISHLWTVTCNGKSVYCPSVDCPFWQHSSTSGRLLVSSVLRLNYNEIKTQFTGCDTSSSIGIHSLQSERLKFTFNGNYIIIHVGVLSCFVCYRCVCSQSTNQKSDCICCSWK